MNSSASLLLTAFFALYNGFLRIRHQSVWHTSVCIYYLLLVLLRSLMLLMEKAVRAKAKSLAKRQRRRINIICSLLLLLLNLSLIVQIILMAKQKRPVNMAMIPAIAMAAYAFYIE